MFRIKTKTGQVEISKEIVVVLLMDLFAAAYAIAARGLSSASLMFPGFLLAGLLIFSILCIQQSIHFPRGTPAEAEGEGNRIRVNRKFVGFVLLVLATLLCFNFLGAVLSVFLFLLVSMIILGVKNKLALILVPVVMVTFVYLVFKVWLAVPLPAGLLTFLK